MVAGRISVTAATKRKIFERIDQQANELLWFLQQYVAHKSVNPGRGSPEDPGEEESCQRRLASELERLGCFDKIDVWADVPVQQVIDACKVYASLMVDCCGERTENE